MDIVFWGNETQSDSSAFSQDLGYKLFVQSHLIPFLKLPVNDCNLQHFGLKYGGTLSYYSANCGEWRNMPRCLIARTDSAFETELDLLQNLPSSLMTLALTPPEKGPITDAKDTAPRQFVSALCGLAAKQEQHQLIEISLNGVTLSSQLQKYLTFMFGYNDRLRQDARDYCFLFN